MSNRFRVISIFAFAAVVSLFSQSAAAQVATTSAEYRLEPEYNDFIGPFTSEIWARVYRPANLEPGRRYPLVIIAHGQHGTCGRNGTSPRIDDDFPQGMQYAVDGTCPAGYTVVKSHEGYEYLAMDLASRNYIVVSVSSLRGFHAGSPGNEDDPGMIRARGRLVLWHLMLLNEWNNGWSTTPASLGFSLQNRLDFNHVGLMGHSRGALAVRSVVVDYRNPNEIWQWVIPSMTVRGLLEIAPPDEEFGYEIDAPDVPLLHLVGLCDAENVALGFNPIPSKHFDRLLVSGMEDGKHFKAQYGIEGANHRYFNNYWQQNDAIGCANQASLLTFSPTETGSLSQQTRAKTAVRNFFMATTGTSADLTLARIFNPTYPAPAGHAVMRVFSASPSFDNSYPLENFSGPQVNQATNDWANIWGPTNLDQNLIHYFHSSKSLGSTASYPYAEVAWGAASSNKFLQVNWSTSVGWNLSWYKYLEFRVDNLPFATNTPEFTIRLVKGDGTLSTSSVSSTSYVTLSPLPGSQKMVDGAVGTFRHEMMKTVRIPFSAFTDVNPGSVRGVRFIFNRTGNGVIRLGSVVATVE